MNTHLYFLPPYVSYYASQLPFVVLVNGTQYARRCASFPLTSTTIQKSNREEKPTLPEKVYSLRTSVCFRTYKLYDEKVSC